MNRKGIIQVSDLRNLEEKGSYSKADEENPVTWISSKPVKVLIPIVISKERDEQKVKQKVWVYWIYKVLKVIDFIVVRKMKEVYKAGIYFL